MAEWTIESMSDKARDFSITMTACPAGDGSIRAIAGELLAGGLAACVQELPITSHYLWKGEVHRDAEVLLLIKGRADCFERIKEVILRLHPYELPEILQLPVSTGLDRYLAWLGDPTEE